MRAAGFNRTYTQLRIKWKNMKKSFVDGKRLIAANNHPYNVCPFYDEIYQLLKDNARLNKPDDPDTGSNGEY